MRIKIFDRSEAGLLLAILMLAGSVAALEQGTLAQRVWQRFAPPLSRGLPKSIGRFSLLAALSGQQRAAADGAYIECLQYIGNIANENDGYWKQALPLYRDTLWLDPSFSHAGREGIAVLGWFLRRPREAKALIGDLRAWDPSETRYPIYLAALGYQEKLDPRGVVEALRPELQRPDAPEMLLRMVGNVYLKARDWRNAQAYWRWLQHRSSDANTLLEARAALDQAAEGMRREAAQKGKP